MRPRPDRFAPYLSTNDGTLFRPDPRGGDYEYEVISDPDTERSPAARVSAGRIRHATVCRSPRTCKSRLRAIAEPIVANIEAEGPRASRRRARALEAYLRDSGEFSYTLQMDVVDRKLDPVEDFLVNRKEGHCEYFASALALLLRSIDIQSRIVNGFKGGDWNELTETLERAPEARP